VALAVLMMALAFPFAGPPVRGQQTPAPDAPDVGEELARMNWTLTRIAEALERQAEGQRLDLSLRRLAVESERVAALERELQGAQATRTGLEDQQFQIRGRLAMFGSEIEDVPDDMPPEHLREVERMLDETQRMLVRLQDQREAQDRRILELENELTRRRADLQALQDRLDRQLDGL
jgi:chromosome segregation ATPase